MSTVLEQIQGRVVSGWNDSPPKLEFLTQPMMTEKALNNSRKYDIFHPSAWGVCLRKIAYQWYNENEKFYNKSDTDIDFRMERLFDNGHAMHARWRDYLDSAGVLKGLWRCPVEKCRRVYGTGHLHGIFNPLRTPGWACACGNIKKLEYEELAVVSGPKYNFEGHCDAVVDVTGLPSATGNPDLDEFVVDFKSMRSDYFDPPTEAKPEHVIQVHIYMWLLELKCAVVLYENKNTQAVKEMVVPRNEKIIDAIKQQSKWLIQMLRHRRLPHRPEGYKKSDFPCMKCEFASICFS
jgi:hypothetical protein